MGDGGGRASRDFDVMEHLRAAVAGASGPVRTPLADAPEVDFVLRAALDPDGDRASRSLSAAITGAPGRFVERLLPRAAERLGEMWLEDRASFAEVTIATARLQAALREVEPSDEAAADAPLVAVVVPPGETHTLGAAVAAWRLRRAGASVMSLAGRPEEEVLRALRAGDVSAVCVSSSAGGGGAAIAGLVGRVRAASGVPVVVGGAILASTDPDAVLRASGADSVSCRPEDVVEIARGRAS